VHIDTDHILPKPFTEEGEEKEALKELHGDMANSMGAGVKQNMPAGMDEKANNEIEHDVETHAAGEYHVHENDPKPIAEPLPKAEEDAFTGGHATAEDYSAFTGTTEVETHAKVHSAPKVDNKEQPVYAVFNELLVAVTSNTGKACVIARSLIKKLGLKTFKTLSGIHGMNCEDPTKRPMSHRVYAIFKKNVEQMSQLEGAQLIQDATDPDKPHMMVDDTVPEGLELEF